MPKVKIIVCRHGVGTVNPRPRPRTPFCSYSIYSTGKYIILHQWSPHRRKIWLPWQFWLKELRNCGVFTVPHYSLQTRSISYQPYLGLSDMFSSWKSLVISSIAQKLTRPPRVCWWYSAAEGSGLVLKMGVRHSQYYSDHSSPLLYGYLAASVYKVL